jgi:hypothetical protein
MTIWDCKSIASLPEGMPLLAKLQTLEIIGCPDLIKECKTPTSSKIAHIPNIILKKYWNERYLHLGMPSICINLNCNTRKFKISFSSLTHAFSLAILSWKLKINLILYSMKRLIVDDISYASFDYNM